MADPNNTKLRSFVPVPTGSHFPIQNLPFGIFRPRAGGNPRAGVAIGEQVVDLAALERNGLLSVPSPTGRAEPLFNRPSLNAFMACGRPVWNEVRERLSLLLRDSETRLRDDAALHREVIASMADVEMLLPVEIGDYTDFYSSRDHATNV